MDKDWIKIVITLPENGLDAQEAAGALAFRLDKIVQMLEGPDGAKLEVWLETDQYSPDSFYFALRELGITREMDLVAISDEAGDDWLLKWKESLQPLPIGQSLIVVPTWQREGAELQGRKAIYLDPGMAFGTGHHATTSLCMELLETYNAPTVLDAGSGTAILGVTAAKLGAQRVVCVDNDPAVLDVARKNVSINGVDDIIEVHCMDVDQVNDLFGVVIANLYLDIVKSMALQLCDSVADGGSLIISGLREEQAEGVNEAILNCGMIHSESRGRGGWVAIVFEKPKSAA